MLRFDLVALSVVLSLPLLAQVPPPIQTDIQSLHLVKRTQPLYPPIAMAAHVSGEVRLQVTIGTDGHVTSSKVLSGPAMLAGAAKDCVDEWVFDPVVDASGKPVPAATVVSLAFDLKAPGHRADEKLAQIFFPLQQRCQEAISRNEKPAHQVEHCTKAAQAAEAFAPGERLAEHRSAFVDASIALLRNAQPQQALDYADKAVLVVRQNHDDGVGASAAYSVRAQALAAMGKLREASDDLSQSEQYERSAISALPVTAPELMKRSYVTNLKHILMAEAQIFAALGQTAAATEKSSAAAAL